MELTPELLGSAAVGAVICIAALGNYIRTLRQQPVKSETAMFAGIAGGLVDKDQMDRLILQITRIADAMTDKNTAAINERLEELTDKLDHIHHPQRRPR